MSQSGVLNIASIPIPPGEVVETLTGNTGGAVGPDGSSNINVLGDGTTITAAGNPGTHTITLSVIGGGGVTLDGDSGTATGSTINVLGTTNEITTTGDNAATLTISLPNLVDFPGNANMSSANGSGTVGVFSWNSSIKSYTAGGVGNFFITGGENLAAIGSIDTNNIGIGSGALANLADLGATDNIAIGRLAGATIYNQPGNVCIGYKALNLTGSSYNIAIGYEAFQFLEGSNPSIQGWNIALGYQAGSLNSGNTGDSSNIYINSPGAPSTSESNIMRLGAGTGTSDQQLQASYISGIQGVVNGGTIPTATILNVDSNDQIGTVQLQSSGATITITQPSNGVINLEASSSAVDTIPYTVVMHPASPYTALSTDYYISADVITSGPGVITILLPDAPVTGRVFIVKDKKGDAPTYNISISTVSGTDTLDGVTTYVMNTAFEVAQFVFNGSNYEIF